jgi:hypothetical protein
MIDPIGRRSNLIVALLLSATAASAAEKAVDLQAECKRVHMVYPRLMLATMAEGPMNCGTSDDGGDEVDCAVGETPDQKVAHARRYAIRQHQEMAYKAASAACVAWDKDPASHELVATATQAIAAARIADSWKPEGR